MRAPAQLRSHGHALRSKAYMPSEMPKNDAPDPLVKALMKRLKALKSLRGLTFDEIEKAGGKGQAVWYKWEHGSDPGLASLESTANALGAELVVRLRDKNEPAPRVSEGMTLESVEIAGLVDNVANEADRRRIADVVFRLIQALPQPVPQLPPHRSTGRKPDPKG